MMIEGHPSQSQRTAIHSCICSIYWPNQPSGTVRGKDRKWIRKLVVTLQLPSRTCWADACSWRQSPTALLQARDAEIQDQLQTLPWTLLLPAATVSVSSLLSVRAWASCPSENIPVHQMLTWNGWVVGGIEWSGVSLEAQIVRSEALFLLERVCLFLSTSWALLAWDHYKF